MTDPFRKVSMFDVEPTVFEPEDPDHVPPEQPPDFIRVPCRLCDRMCVRSDVDGVWVHDNETFVVQSYNKRYLDMHKADPDIIDIEVLDEQ